MPNRCTICYHAQRADIEAAVLDGAAFHAVAARYGVSKTALLRHKAQHISAQIASVQEAREEAQALHVVRQLREINEASRAILAQAKRQRKPETALRAIDRITKQIELQAKLLGDLDDKPQVNVLISPEWIRIRTVIMEAIWPYMDARLAVASALERLDSAENVS